MVPSARIAASQRTAPRHPCASSNWPANGMKITDAKPATNVSAVSATPRRRRNHTANAANAGSYSTAACATPRPTHTR